MTFNKCSINGVTYGDPLDERGVAVDVTEVRSVVHVFISGRLEPGSRSVSKPQDLCHQCLDLLFLSSHRRKLLLGVFFSAGLRPLASCKVSCICECDHAVNLTLVIKCVEVVLIWVLSRTKFSTFRSCLGLGARRLGFCLDLGLKDLVDISQLKCTVTGLPLTPRVKWHCHFVQI